MAQNKTRPTTASVEAFIESVDHAGKREDARVLDAMFRRVTGEKPVMWGPSIIGYGQYRYRYDSGREGDMCRVGFSPRKAKHSFYLSSCGKDMDETAFAALLGRLGKHDRGKGCLYINKLADVDLAMLEEMAALAWKYSLECYPEGA